MPQRCLMKPPATSIGKCSSPTNLRATVATTGAGVCQRRADSNAEAGAKSLPVHIDEAPGSKGRVAQHVEKHIGFIRAHGQGAGGVDDEIAQLRQLRERKHRCAAADGQVER